MSLLRRLIRTSRKLVGTARHDPPGAENVSQKASRVEGLQRVTVEVAALAVSGRYADAYAAVGRALERAPGDTDLLFTKASVLLDWERFQQSREVYEEAQRGGLRSEVLYRQLGWACFKTGDLVSAESNLDKAVAIDPRMFESHFCLGVVLKARDRIDDAALSLQRAVELRPDEAALERWLEKQLS